MQALGFCRRAEPVAAQFVVEGEFDDTGQILDANHTDCSFAAATAGRFTLLAV